MPASTGRCRESCNNGTTRYHTPFWGDTGKNVKTIPTFWLLPSIFNLQRRQNRASQMQSKLLQLSSPAQKKPIKHMPKLGLLQMLGELPLANRWPCQSMSPGYETKQYSPAQNQVLCGHFSYPTSRKGTRITQAANALLTRTPQNPPHHSAKSNRHHLQQPHQELTL
jgi:hypothetical protein